MALRAEQVTSFSQSIKIVIPGSLPSLNEFILANRSNRFSGAKMKKEASDTVRWYAQSQVPRAMKTIDTPFFVQFHWYCKDRKKDKDNIAFAKKFILDGLQEAGIISQDNWKALDGFSDNFYLDPKEPKIEVLIQY